MAGKKGQKEWKGKRAMSVWHGTEAVCLVLGLACIFYYIIIVGYAGITADFAWIWLVGAAFLFAIAGGMFAQERHPTAVLSGVLRAAWILMAIGILVIGFSGAHIFAGMRQKPEQNLPYVIVLGAQVQGMKVSKALRKRLDCAAKYAKENPDTVFFLSGGQGDGEDITEAEAMYEYLCKAGVDAGRLRKEDRSTTTWENLKFSNELLPLHTEPVGIISNDFHIYRAVQMARRQGYEDVCGIPSPSDAVMQPHYVLREAFAVLAATARGKMRICLSPK